MDGDKQVCPVLPRLFEPIPVGHVVVALADQYAPHTRARVHCRLELVGNGQNDVFFPCSSFSDGAGVFTTVTRIDGDDDVAILFLNIGDLLGRPAVGVVIRVQVDHQSMPILPRWFEQEALQPGIFLQVQNHAQCARRGLAMAYVGDDARVLGFEIERTRETGAVEIDDDAVGVFECKEAVFGAGAQVEHGTGFVRVSPDPEATDLGRKNGGRHQQADQGNDRAHCHWSLYPLWQMSQ